MGHNMKIGDLVRLSDDLAGAIGILVEKKQDAELSKILWADVGFSWEKNSRISFCSNYFICLHY